MASQANWEADKIYPLEMQGLTIYQLQRTSELGVISAQSSAGVPMVGISWTEMQCPITGQIEHRKVAKVGG